MNISSILWVTINPPKILIAAKKVAKNPKAEAIPKFTELAAISAPIITIPEIAFVTDISGVCNEGVTFQTT